MLLGVSFDGIFYTERFIRGRDEVLTFAYRSQELENHHLDTARNMLKCMQLKPQIRQQLTLLLQRQHLEEQELRLRHWMELEKFHKGLGKRFAVWLLKILFD